MTKKNKKIFLLLITVLLSFSVVFSQEEPTEEISVPNLSEPLDPCPNPEREVRFIYRERVVHEERQFRAEHPGCGGDIMMRKWQQVAIEAGYCRSASCNNPTWLGDFVQIYDRYTPSKSGELFEEVGSWQKAWPSSAEWLTEEELEEKYGEPIPFPTCQNDCLQAPPGVPEKVGAFGQEDPYYFNNPWLPEVISGEVPERISDLREKNILGGRRPLDKVSLPAKIFWWNIPGWHEGWIENGQLEKCDNDDPQNIACVDSYIIRFDNINREDRPATFYRHEVINFLINKDYEYTEASKIYEDLLYENEKAYQAYRSSINDRESIDTMRYDRDNILYCDNCGVEQEIWLNDNTFNPLEFNPKYDYNRPKRAWIKNNLLGRFEDNNVKEIIEKVYNSYGRPAFFRSGVEHSYTLQAACAPHDYLEEDEGRRGPEAHFSFQTSDSPELITPIDPNWVSPYDPKEYDPNYDPTRIKTEEYGYEKGYRYPAERTPGIGSFVVNPQDPDGELIPPPPEEPAEPAEGEGLIPGEIEDNSGLECQTSYLKKESPASEDVKNALGIEGTSNVDIYEKWLTSQGVRPSFSKEIANAGGTTTIPPLFEADPTHCWRKIIPTAQVVQELAINQNGWSIGVNSGYRDYPYNSKIDGSTTSYHMRNMALDITVNGTSLSNLHSTLNNARKNGSWTGGLALYNSFIHIDTRDYNTQWQTLNSQNNQFTFLKNSINEGDEPLYMEESRNLGNWINSLEDPFSLWSENPGALVFQDQVPFRQNLNWTQQWYQDSPQEMPRPPKSYLITFGDSIKVNQKTIGMEDYGKPVLEDCHSQLKNTFDGMPVCEYKTRPKESHEENLLYPLPNHIDREIEYFTLSEDKDVDVYSWNVATCRDEGNTACTDFSQKWRFQLDENEEDKLFAPKNSFPKNITAGATDEQATVGFPFTLKWERRFGARSYVYRIRKSGESDWEKIRVQKGREVYYDLGELTYDPYSYDLIPYSWSGYLDFNTYYQWDVKACWDENTDHGFNPKSDSYYEDVLNWVEKEKECSPWRSENFNDAPFEFLTMGKEPTGLNPSYDPDSPGIFNTKETRYPLDFEWNKMPGAKSYAIVIQSKEDSKIEDVDLNPQQNYQNNQNNNTSKKRIPPKEADRAAIISENYHTYLGDLKLNKEYLYQVYSCANPVEEDRLYLDLSLSDSEMDLSNFYEDMAKWGCSLENPSEIQNFIPYLPAPNLLLGEKDEEKPTQLTMDERTQTLQWKSIPKAKGYRIRIGKPTNELSLIESAYGQQYLEEKIPDEDLLHEDIVSETSLLYTFPEVGTYSWTVQACLTEDCEAVAGDNHSIVKGKISDIHYIEIVSPVFSNFKGVVPCGRNIDIFTENPNLDSRDNCRIGHLFVMIGLIIEEILIKIIVPYSLIILLLYTGYLYYTALGDPQTMKKVFSLWNNALKGYLLIFLAWTIIGLGLTLVGYQFGIWWQITGLNL